MNTMYGWLIGLTCFGFTLNTAAECNSVIKTSFSDSTVVLEEPGVLVDRRTGLMWQRCALGFQWQNNTCIKVIDQISEFTWQDALVAAAANSTSAGYDDWRLPNKNELDSIVERACYDPAINLTLFPATEVKGYWTNTPNNFNEFSAWAVNFTNGDHMSTSRTNLLAVRLVRQVQ